MSRSSVVRLVVPSLPIVLVAVAAVVGSSPAQVTGDHVLLSWNDLGMHCMNRDHLNLSVLPPYNDLYAQVIQRGDATHVPQVTSAGLVVRYSIPGNTYSVGKTDFWTWSEHLFGVVLPPDVGLTGKGLTGTMDPQVDHFTAIGIPITPFPDATPTVEDPYQQALVILEDEQGIELARAMPVIPVSVELNCVSAGCHASELGILAEHPGPSEGGFDIAAKPILCASCHGDPILGGTGPGTAGYFSLRMHEKHAFLDSTLPGIAGCYGCHPGPQAQCLRGTMATDHGLICQDCHGDMQEVASSIDAGRVPWFDEPSCGDCHASAYSEPAGQLFRNSTGHGGVFCEGCHNSTHADFPTREPRDNAIMVALQGHVGQLDDCTVCHGVIPDGPGPHGTYPTGVIESEILRGTDRLVAFPSPTVSGTPCTIRWRNSRVPAGRLLVFDARGRTIRMLQGGAAVSGEANVRWDGRDAHGQRVAPGVYFVRWDAGGLRAGGKLLVVE